jgi:CRISPR-associated protein Cmr6
MTYPLPRDTAAVLAQQRAAISNLHLYLSRYIDREVDRQGEGWEVTKDEKALRRAPAILKQPLNQALIRDHSGRWQAMVAGYPGARAFTGRARTRCAVGLGAKGTREVGLRLHHLYGFPIIPGSALKGLARAYALLTWAEQLAPRLQVGMEAADVLEVLGQGDQYKGAYGPYLAQIRADAGLRQINETCGAQEHAGLVCFFDAVPNAPLALETDIINPHYPDYYRAFGKDPMTPPADYYSPIPVTFLTVAAESVFLFAVAPRRAGRAEDEAATARALTWLQEGLAELGMGAKTTSGYGLFGHFARVE